MAPGRGYMIHMTHELEYEALGKVLPESVHVGYDGLKLSFDSHA